MRRLKIPLVRFGINGIFQPVRICTTKLQANNPFSAAQNHITHAFNNNQTVVRSGCPETYGCFGTLDNQRNNRPLYSSQSFISQINICEYVITPNALRRNNNIIGIGNIYFNIKPEFRRIDRNFFNPVFFLQITRKCCIRTGSVLTVTVGVYVAAARSCPDNRRAVGILAVFNNFYINNSISNAVGIYRFALNIKNIFITGTTKNNHIGIHSDKLRRIRINHQA